ncbi:PAS domain-containing protein [Dyadobacter sp. CY345]|uniref:PAS domain-containing protein n=1 Tax=Dyadobacter sp. CY345 TaxID=2909335 RepID=UPI001F2D0DA0|nr:PAS domain-containing protein [Dyadobacter sp. CY345]MCF2447430.1 PAS domain-containing protein [Dyadobacter sp. CY345]
MVDQNFSNSVFKALPTPTIVLLPDAPTFTVVCANDAYLEMVQLGESDLEGKGFFDAFPNHPYVKPPEWKSLFEKLLQDKLPNKTPVFEFPVPDKATHLLQIRNLISSNTPIFDDNNEVKYIIRSVSDITELVKTEINEKTSAASLDKNEKFLIETQRIAKVGSWEVDMESRLLKWTDVAREIHEVESGNEIDFDTVSSFYSQGKDWEALSFVIQRAAQQGEFFDLEVSMISAKGNLRWVRTTGLGELKDGRFARLYGTMQDITDRKVIEEELLEAKNKFESLIQTVDGIVWETDVVTHEFTFVSNQVKTILGYSPQEWMDTPHFWENHIHVDDREEAIRFCIEKSKISRNYDFDYRMIHANGSLVWIKDMVSVIQEGGKNTKLRGVMIDITEAKRFTELERLEKTVLELNSQKNSTITEVLTTYILGIEQIFPKMLCSILQVKNRQLYNWASPSLPAVYIESIEGIPALENVGSCGTAAFLKEIVIASDIENDSRWAGFKQLALPFQLRACWSHPVINSEGEVMATFGIYYNEIRSPQSEEVETIDRFTAILRIILENRHNSDLLEENTQLMKQGQELAHFGNWQWDFYNDKATWSDSLFAIYGLDKVNFKASFQSYQEILHPDDRQNVVDKIKGVLNTRKDIVFEERVIRPTGEIRHLKSWGRLKTDLNGMPVKMIGACLDITEGKKVQRDLKASESRLLTLVEELKSSNARYEYVNKATRDAIYDWNMATDHIAWGDGFNRLFGYEVNRERYPVNKWASLIHESDVDFVGKSLSAALQNRTQHNWRAEYQFRKADGTYAFVQENGYIIRNPEGDVIRMIGVLRDVSQRKKTQLKLVRKSALLAAIAEVNSSLLQYDNWLNAIDHSFAIVGAAINVDRVYYFENFTDPVSGKIYCNQRLEWNSGRFESQANNPELQNVPHETLADLVSPLEKNKPYIGIVSNLPDSEFKSSLIAQEIKSLLIFPVFAKNKFYGYIGFDDCQNERKWDEDERSFLKTIAVNLAKAIETDEADKALVSAFEEKNRILESIQDGFFAVSKDWIVTYWNKEAESLTGIKREEIVGKSIWKTYYRNIPLRFYNLYLKATQENIPVRFEEQLLRLDKWFEVNAYPTTDGLTVYFKDITERKITEAQLKEMHQELEKHIKVLAVSNAELEQFAYVASHDLQEPLRMVTSFLTLLEKKYGESLDEKARVYIYYAVDGAKRMRQIILDLLDFSRVGKNKENPEKVNVDEVICEILTLYQKKIKDKKAKIEYSEMPQIMAFKAPLRQVFQNLISNALKYQRKDQSPHVKIVSIDTPTHWKFSVTDNGLGINNEYFEKIFVIFQRLHNREDYSGTGMGLAITKKIVESLDGEIWVESEEGKGSTFYFTIAKHFTTL